MPCIDERSEEKSKRRELDDARKIDKLTRLLCEACQLVDFNRASEELTEWNKKHQEADRKRKEKQRRIKTASDKKKKFKKSGLSKLSMEERKALGI